MISCSVLKVLLILLLVDEVADFKGNIQEWNEIIRITELVDQKNKSLIFFLQSLLNRTAGLNPATLQRCLKCCIKIAKLNRSMYIVIRRALLAEILFVYSVSFPPVFDLLINVTVSRLRASFDWTFFLAIDNPLVFFNILKNEI